MLPSEKQTSPLSPNQSQKQSANEVIMKNRYEEYYDILYSIILWRIDTRSVCTRSKWVFAKRATTEKSWSELLQLCNKGFRKTITTFTFVLVLKTSVISQGPETGLQSHSSRKRTSAVLSKRTICRYMSLTLLFCKGAGVVPEWGHKLWEGGSRGKGSRPTSEVSRHIYFPHSCKQDA